MRNWLVRVGIHIWVKQKKEPKFSISCYLLDGANFCWCWSSLLMEIWISCMWKWTTGQTLSSILNSTAMSVFCMFVPCQLTKINFKQFYMSNLLYLQVALVCIYQEMMLNAENLKCQLWRTRELIWWDQLKDERQPCTQMRDSWAVLLNPHHERFEPWLIHWDDELPPWFRTRSTEASPR